MKTRLLQSARRNFSTMCTSKRTALIGIYPLLVIGLLLSSGLQAQDCPTIFSVDTTDPTDCQSNGSIEVFADDTFPAGPFYVYSVDGGETYINTSTINNLPAGTYTITVQNTETTCTTTWPVPVTLFGGGDPVVIESVNITPPTDCGADDGIIVINVQGGGSTLVSSFEYSITGSGGPWVDTNVFTDRPAGTYDIWARNQDDSCPTNWGEETLSDPPQPSIVSHVVFPASNCSSPNGSITLTGSGGILPRQYSISGAIGPFQTSNFFPDLAPSTYEVWVRNADGTCLNFYNNLTVGGVTPPVISQVTGLDPTGCNTNDGRVTITASGVSTLEYSITGSGGPYSTNPVFEDQDAGTYDVFVRYTNGSCLTSGGSITLTGPEPPIISPSDVSATPVSDCGASDGSITIAFPDNYQDNMEFSINGMETWQLSNVFIGLITGTYNVWVRYTDGTCERSYGFVTVGTPLGPLIGNIDITANDASDCGASDGSIVIDSPITYEYSLNGNNPPWSIQTTYGGLAPATYEVWARNEDGTCPTFHSFVTVGSPEAPIINGASDITITPVSTCGFSNGTIRIALPLNYNPQMEFSITGLNGTWTLSSLFTDIAAGIYDIWVRNGDGSCPVNYGQFEVTEPNSIQTNLITVDPTDISDCGLSDGSMSVCSANEFYEYSINGSGGPWDNPSGNCSEFTNLAAGTYSVWVRNDDGTCETFWGDVTINEPQAPFITNVSSSDVSDCGAADGSITITAGGGDGNLQYSIFGTGGPFGPASQFNGLSGGNYDVYVRNGDGTCLTFWGTETIDEPELPIINNVNVTDVSDCGANDGSIQIFATGSSLEYSINGSGGPFGASPNFSNLNGGSYNIWVRNSDGTCPVPWGIEILDEPQSPNISAVNTTDVSDCGAGDGTILITASGGDGNLQYSISGPGGPFGPSSSFAGLSGGNYDVYVRNGDGTCLTFWGTETISEPETPVISGVTPTDVSDCGANDGSIQIIASGSSIEYSINGSGGPYSSSPNFTNLAANTYDIWVRNTDGTCAVSWGFEIINEPQAPFINDVTSADVSDCGAADGSIQITAGGGDGNLQYSIFGTGGPFGPASNFNGLSGGDYDVYVRNGDGTCLTFWGTETITEPNTPSISNVTVNDVSDCGSADGSILISATGSNIEYSINGFSGPYDSSPSFSNLLAGNYDIWVRNNDGTCAVSWGIETVDEPDAPIISDVFVAGVQNCGADDGFISITASGSSGTLEYSITGPAGIFQSSAVFPNLASGDYDIWVQYNDGTCLTSWGVETVDEGEFPVISTVDVQNVSDCGAADGSIDITASISVGLLEYSINGQGGPYQLGSSFTNLLSGTYDIWVRPNERITCATNWGTVFIDEPQPPVIVQIITTDPSDCGVNDATVEIIAELGLGTYEYSISGEFGPWIPGNFITGLSGSDLFVWVRNSDGTCPVEYGLVTFNVPTEPNIDNVVANDVTDCGANDGSIQIFASGGTGSYEYSIDGSGGPYNGNNFITNLNGGTYDIWVRNDDGTCAVSWGTVTINEPSQLTISSVNAVDVSDCGGSDGSIQIFASGGTSLEYSIDGPGGPFNPASQFTGLSSGSYDVWVQNSGGTCLTEWGIVNVDEPTPPVVSNVVADDISDCNLTDGVIEIFASGSSGTLEYSINGPTGPWNASNLFTNMAANTYNIWIQYDDGTCLTEWGDVTIIAPVAPIISQVTPTNPTDCGLNDGTIDIFATGGTGNFEYSVDGEFGTWLSTSTVINLSAGDYFVWVRNDDGTCAVEHGLVTLTAPQPPSITNVVVDDVTDCGLNDGVIEIFATGGTGNFEYSIDGSGGPWVSSQLFLNRSAGNYDIWVRNDDGTCLISFGTVTINEPVAPIITQVIPTNPSNCNATDGSLEIIVQGGPAGFEYSTDGPGGPWDTDNIVQNLGSGTFNVWVRNDDGSCAIEFGPVTLEDPPLPVILDVLSQSATDCEVPNGEIIIVVPDGVNYQYSIDGINWFDENTFFNLDAGTYSPMVRNDDGTCIVMFPQSIVLSAPDAPIINDVIVDPISDCGQADATITIDATPGSSNILYSIDGGNNWSDVNIFTGQSPGDYNVAVQNNDGTCQVDFAQVIVIEDLELPQVFSVDITPPSDCGATDAIISIDAEGNDGTLEYSINGGENWTASSIINNVAPGFYNISVRYDNMTCRFDYGQIEVEALIPPFISDVLPTNPSDCGATDGEIEVFVENGTGQFEYSLDSADGPWQPESRFQNLPSGEFNLWVRNDDGTCVVAYATTIELIEPNPPAVSSLIATNLSDCGSNDGSIEIFGAGGTGSYEYSINGSGGPFNSNNLRTNLAPGFYEVWIQNDDGTCAVFHEIVEIEEPPLPTITDVLPQNPSDCGSNDGSLEITATGGTGNYEYSVTGETGTWFPENIALNLEPGFYSVWVRNDDGTCANFFGEIELVDPPTPLVTNVALTDPSDCGTNDGIIEIFASGGTGDYEYSITGIDGEFNSSSIFFGLPGGFYEVVIRNADGTCTNLYDIVELVEAPTPIIEDVTFQSTSDCGVADGEIQIIVQDGAAYEFSIDGIDWRITNSFLDLEAGTYTPMVRNLDGSCIVVYQESIVLTAPDAPSIDDVMVQQLTDCGTQNASINIIATPGSNGILYTIDGTNFVDTPDFPNLPAGDYQVAVSNSDGSCLISFAQTVTIEELIEPIIFDISSTPPSDCGTSDAQIIIDAEGTTGTLLYSIDGGNEWQLSSVFTGLEADDYQVVVSYDAEQCFVSASEPTIIAAPEAPSVSVVSSENITDCEVPNGTITLSGSGGSGEYEFSLTGTDWQSDPEFVGLDEDLFTVFIRNADGSCEVQGEDIQILGVQPPLLSVSSSSAPSTCDAANGSIELLAENGSGDYEYRLDNGAWVSTNVFDNLEGGTLLVEVRNAGGNCGGTTQIVVELAAPDAPQLSVLELVNPQDCGTADGIIELQASGGSGEYLYRLDFSTWTAIPRFENVAPGIYIPWVSNADGTCARPGEPITIGPADAPDISLSSVQDATACVASDGIITLSSTAAGTVLFRLDYGVWQESNVFTNVPVGTHSTWVQVVGSSCVVRGPFVTVGAPDAASLLAVEVTQPEDCNSDDGRIRLAASPEQSFVQYRLGNIPWQNSPVFEPVQMGVYQPAMLINDGTCQVTGPPIAIGPPDAPILNVQAVEAASSCELADGSIRLSASGPGEPFQFRLNNNAYGEAQDFQNLAIGTYIPWVIDANGNCEVQGSPIVITAPGAPDLNVDAVIYNDDCEGANGSIMLSSTAEDVEFSLDGITWNVTGNFPDLLAQIYIPTVRNLDGSCLLTGEPIAITAPESPQLSIDEVVQGTDCDNPDGQIRLSASGGSGDYQFQLNGGNWEDLGQFNSLGAGMYTTAVRNADGTCVVIGETIEITAPEAPQLSVDEVVQGTDCDNPDGQIRLSASGGSGDYQFQLNGGNWEDLGQFNMLGAGMYTTAVRNADGTCLVIGETIEITAPEAPQLSVDEVVQGTDCDNPDGQIILSASGGSGDYQFQLNGGNWEDLGQFNMLGAGMYTTAVRNADGTCLVIGETIEITAPEAPQLSVDEVVQGTDCDNPDGQIILSASGGSGDYQFQLNGGNWEDLGQFNSLGAGMYTTAVRNADGTCVVIGETIEITAPEAPQLSISEVIDADCDQNTGSIELAASGGSGSYEYTLDNVVWQASPVFTGLIPATYVPGIRNLDGSCVTIGETITITESDAPELIVEEVMNATDCETENGSISLQASGGNGEYEYRLSTTDWQTSSVFEGLGAGTVIASVRSGGCETFSEEITIVAPDAPVLSIEEVFNASDCDSDNGAIILSVEGNDDYEFSLDGIDWQGTPFFVQLRIGDYIPMVRTLDGNCEVSLTPIEITADNTPQLSVQAVENVSDCGAADGSITLLGVGTTGDLEYQLEGLLNWQEDQTFVNLQPGMYTPIVRYTDGSCETVGEPIEITEPNSPVLAATEINDATVCDGTDGSIIITAIGGSGEYQYSLDGDIWQDDPDFNNLGAGEVTAYIRNADGSCVVVGETQQISAPEGPQIEVLAIVDVSDCGSENGAIILSGTGGTGPYEFSLGDENWGGPNIVQLPQGTYEPRIRFADGTCEEVGDSVTIGGPLEPIVAIGEVSAADDCNENNGSITLIGSAGNGTYQYSLDGITWQAGPVFGSLAPGEFTAFIRNEDETCEVQGDDILLEGQAALVLEDVAVIQPEVCTPNSGEIRISVAYPNLDELEYSIDNGVTWSLSSVFPDLGMNTYNVLVRTTTGACTQTWAEPIELVVDQITTPSFVDFNATIPSNCTATNGGVFLSAEGGTGIYEYSIDNGATWQETGEFASLAAANYLVLVRDVTYPCLVSDAVLVELFPAGAPEIDGVTVSQPTECELEDAEIRIELANPTPETQYSIDGGVTWTFDPVFTGIGGGDYTIAVLNPDNECLVIFPETVEIIPAEPLEVLGVSSLDPTDCGIADGSINIEVADPDQLFEVTYNEVQWQFTTELNGLPAGEYTLTFRNPDGNCVFSWEETITLREPTEVVLEELTAAAPTDCGLSDGSISLAGSANPAWEYQLDENGWGDEIDWQDLSAGEYTVSVRAVDYPNCQDTETLELLAELNTENLDLEVAAAADCIDGGSINVTSPTPEAYLYSIDNGDTWLSEALITGLQPGNYTVLVSDETQLCQATLGEDILIDGPELPEYNGFESTDSDGCTEPTGTLQVLTSGQPNLSYSLEGLPTANTSGLFTGLVPGDYLLLITDTVTQCTTSLSESLNVGGLFPLNLEDVTFAGPACADEATGTASIMPQGGLAPYTYDWSNGGTESSIEELEAGAYLLTVTDANGCADTTSVDLPVPEGLADWGIEMMDTVLCGETALTLCGDLPELADFYWQDAAGTQYSDSCVTFTEPGTVSVHALTLEGCLLEDELEFEQVEGEFAADFLMPAEGVINEPVVAVDITFPVPESISWIFDTNEAESVATLPTQQILLFDEPGTYTVGMSADLGECTAYLEKDIRIYGSRDSLSQDIPEQFFTLIRSFELFPNPNRGDFQVRLYLNSVQPADLWIFYDNGELITFESAEGQDYYAFPFNNQDLPAGVYTAVVRVAEEWLYLNFVVL